MEDRTLGSTELLEGVPEALRPFLDVMSAPLPPSFEPIVRAFWTATEAIEPAVRIRMHIAVVFSTAPFSIDLANCELRVTPKDGVINLAVANIAFIDCNKIRNLPFPLIVASILEELVHIWLNVKDESLTGKIVAFLYPAVSSDDDIFRVVSAPVDPTAEG